MKDTVKIPCQITGRLFARFAMYDAFVMKKRWRGPLLFAVLMGCFSALCFTVLKDKEQSSLLGMVLLSVGIVLPLVWIFSYIVSIRNQINKSELYLGKVQYIVELGQNGITVTNGKEKADYKWEDVKCFVDTEECAFLYMNNSRAFILPRYENWDDMMLMAESKLDSSKLKVKK